MSPQLLCKVMHILLLGWRKNMEDYCISAKIDNDMLLLGVFDGHGGPEVACFVSRNIAK